MSAEREFPRSAVRDGLHTVDVTIGHYGMTRLSFRCLADGAADPKCWMACPEPSCEQGCSHIDEHTFVNQGECMVVAWLDNSDADECVIGTETSAVLPIEYDWHGEGVDWAFAGGAS
jgi:hypothetical protein